MHAAYVYILHCADGSYYVGMTQRSPKQRLAEHNLGYMSGYTKRRRPVRLVFTHPFDRITQAHAVERQIKGWSRAKKAALVAGDIGLLKALSRRKI